jgi:uncharacterized protein (TIGR02996 family)
VTPDDPFTGYFDTHPIADSNDLLVYADWLDEHDDPRAPAVRAEAAAKRLLPPADVHGVLDAERNLGARYAAAQLTVLSTLPWPEEVLRRCAGTHLLVAGCPLSILDLQARRPDCSLWGSERPWYAAEPFARTRRVGSRWHLLRKASLPDSTHKTFAGQKSLLPRGERVPRACEIGYAVILHHLVTGERLLGDASVRCADSSSHGARIFVGQFFTSGLYIGPEWHDHPGRSIGLASGWTP